MAESMSNMEIEDVLSSIRKLVSEQGSPAPEGRAEKLVLTPKHRVTEGEDDAPVAEAPVEEQSSAPEQVQHSVVFSHRDRAARDTAGVKDIPQDGDVQAPVEPVETVAETAVSAAELPVEEPEVAPVKEAARPAEPAVEPAEPEKAAEEPADMAAEEVAVSEAADVVKPVNFRSGRPHAEVEVEDADEAEAPGMFDESQDAILDEDTLRELVREVIRQELQGALGERITRNVRKLVRSEINRALSSRDFD